jgi:hypothetical protein
MNMHKEKHCWCFIIKNFKNVFFDMPIIRNKWKQCQCFIVKNVKDDTLCLKDMNIMSSKIQNVSISEKLELKF